MLSGRENGALRCRWGEGGGLVTEWAVPSCMAADVALVGDCIGSPEPARAAADASPFAEGESQFPRWSRWVTFQRPIPLLPLRCRENAEIGDGRARRAWVETSIMVGQIGLQEATHEETA